MASPFGRRTRREPPASSPQPPEARPPGATPRKRIFPGWWIALGGATSNFFAIGFVNYGFGVLYKPMREELGWSMAAIIAGVSIRSFEQGFMSPVIGFVIDRIGPRRTALTGTFILIAGMLMFSMVHSIWLYYLSSVVIAVGQSFGAFNAYTVAIVNWFDRKRGRAMGILNAGNGLAYMAVPILALFVTLFGWRAALVVGAATILVTCLPLAWMIKDKPEPYGYGPDGDPPVEWESSVERLKKGDPGPSEGLSVREGVRTPAFYMLVMAQMTGTMQMLFSALQVPHLQAAGFSTGAIALFTSVFALSQVALRISTGWWADIVGRRRILIVSYLLKGLGFLVFAQFAPGRFWLFPLFFLTFSAGHASWIITSQSIAADYFGRRRFATLRGLTSILTMPTGLAAPIAAGMMFDRTGDYVVTYTVAGCFTAMGALWIFLIRRPMWRELQAQRAAAESVAAS